MTISVLTVSNLGNLPDFYCFNISATPNQKVMARLFPTSNPDDPVTNQTNIPADPSAGQTLTITITLIDNTLSKTILVGNAQWTPNSTKNGWLPKTNFTITQTDGTVVLGCTDISPTSLFVTFIPKPSSPNCFCNR